MTRLQLSQVSLCAVDTRAPELAAQALMQSMAGIDFGRVMLFTRGWAPDRALPGIEVVEMQRNGTQGMCCGAGGARMWMEENTGTKVNDERAAEAISTGASRVATACPFCYIMLDDGVKGAGYTEDQVRVADVSIHLLEAIEAGEAKRQNEQPPLVGAWSTDEPLTPVAGD